MCALWFDLLLSLIIATDYKSFSYKMIYTLSAYTCKMTFNKKYIQMAEVCLSQ